MVLLVYLFAQAFYLSVLLVHSLEQPIHRVKWGEHLWGDGGRWENRKVRPRLERGASREGRGGGSREGAGGRRGNRKVRARLKRGASKVAPMPASLSAYLPNNYSFKPIKRRSACLPTCLRTCLAT